MRVKIKVQTVYQGKVYYQGEEYDVDKAVGEQWIDRNLATEVKSTSKKETKKTGDK